MIQLVSTNGTLHMMSEEFVKFSKFSEIAKKAENGCMTPTVYNVNYSSECIELVDSWCQLTRMDTWQADEKKDLDIIHPVDVVFFSTVPRLARYDMLMAANEFQISWLYNTLIKLMVKAIPDSNEDGSYAEECNLDAARRGYNY